MCENACFIVCLVCTKQFYVTPKKDIKKEK